MPRTGAPVARSGGDEARIVLRETPRRNGPIRTGYEPRRAFESVSGPAITTGGPVVYITANRV